MVSKIFFYKGSENVLDKGVLKTQKDSKSEEQIIQDAFLKVLDNKNLSFLLGSGCSSYKIDTLEVGVPTMKPMAQEFFGHKDYFIEQKQWLKKEMDIDVTDPLFAENLENFLSTLHGLSFYHSQISSEDKKKNIFETIQEKDFKDLDTFEKIESIILDTRNFILEKCINKKEDNSDESLLNLYQIFYRKLLNRSSSLSKLSIFTTNYDIYSEKALDSLGYHYVNGFTGGILKFFNPAIFNYALAEKMDISNAKWNVIDNFFYLYKIHGSINWVESSSENKLFKVREIQDINFEKLKSSQDITMIYPTPLKYNASLSSPYSDLFREFQKKLMQNNNVLVTIGYSFSDDHINNLIFQAFTIPTFRLIILGDPRNGNIEKLFNLQDPRIWIIYHDIAKGGEETPCHYFKGFVEKILPGSKEDIMEKKTQDTINNLRDLLK